MSILVIIATVVAALGQAVEAWPKLNPYRPALLFEVEYRVAQSKPVINELLRWRLEDQIDRQEKYQSDLNGEQTTLKGKLTTENDPQNQAIFNTRLRNIDDELKRSKKNKEKLEKRLHGLSDTTDEDN